jgi:BlaI family transcriptional regulator, penicillinase repressor
VAKTQLKSARLSHGELELLSVLWEGSSLSIVEAQRLLVRPIGYTTVQTRLDRLVKKGVARRSKERPAKYSAAITREQVSAGDLKFILERVTDGQIVPLVAHLVQDRALPQEEIDELKRLIAEAEDRAVRNLSSRGKP